MHIANSRTGVGAEIRRLRRSAGISMEMLSTLHPSTISEVERGRPPLAGTVRQIAEALEFVCVEDAFSRLRVDKGDMYALFHPRIPHSRVVAPQGKSG
jgi:transcriptional regulator with XRE-family HTH domain